MAIYSGFFPLNMVIFHCYVSLPEGNHKTPTATEGRGGPFSTLGQLLHIPFRVATWLRSCLWADPKVFADGKKMMQIVLHSILQDWGIPPIP